MDRQTILNRLPRLRALALGSRGLISCVSLPPDTRLLALTFDDGPSFDNTPAIIDLLQGYGARATFFVVGREAEMREKLLEKIVATGNEVGNHSYTHPQPGHLSSAALADEIEQTDAVIRRLVGRRTTL